jgi:hypothetical protein|tara:strand:- start:65 stop:550 length:486 start_codon:yes stop_codon:yes gene_type:complete
LKKRIIIGIVAFVIGILIAFYSEGFFRKQIQELYQWATSNGIQFVGKNFYIFGNGFHYLSFGLTFSLFVLTNWNKKRNLIIKNGILTLLIFGIVLFGISVLDANLKIIECTACDDGIRKLHWNEIKYGNILGISSILSIIPSGILLIKKWKKDVVGKRQTE